MRILFTTFSERAHFYSQVPLAWALRAAGHEVRVASQPKLTDAITAAGLTAVPVGEDHRLSEMQKEHADAWGSGGAGFGGLHKGEGETTTPEERLRRQTLLTTLYNAPINNDSFVDGLVEFARAWQPDLVIWEPQTYAGAVAARVVGAAHARLLWGPDVMLRSRETFLADMAQLPEAERQDPLVEWLTGLLERHGATFHPEVVTGQWTIDPCPEGVRLPVGVNTVPMRYVPYNGPAVVPEWLHEAPAKPRVCLTMGGSLREHIGHDGFPISALGMWADLDIELIATLVPFPGETDPQVPDNARVIPFVPMHALLPTCSAIVHYGGGGTWSTALNYGVPQLMIPKIWDTVVKAEHLQESGAGLFVHADNVTGEALHDALARLVDDPSFKENALRLRDEIHAQPSPAELVATLEKLTAEYREDKAATV
ncbi:activator-dependent family glycosyltransferase [Streptomyces katrae]|uniref:activator-dependent family glycosyltransferase n=1 Tax=Streptomyces katrae TaxID=68223 RepID=UPI0009A509E4|nr:activator-dependent family glycosyltransferase [Streptomyces katrae]